MKVSTCSTRPILVPCGLDGFDYQIDPYVGCGHYCYYCYVLSDAETDWTKEVLIHKDIVGQLRAELEGIPPQTIYMGYITDPYQPCEDEYRQTRKVLELLSDKGFSASILTKSDLILRDMDILKSMNDANVSISAAFTDNDVRRQFEDNTMDTERRIKALREAKSAGIATGTVLCPVIPYITDVKALMDMLIPCADVIWIYPLNIQDRLGPNWRNVEGILNNHFPDLKKKIEEVVFSKDHQYWAQLRQYLQELQKDRQLDLRIHV